jgi:hypothetical protein
LDDVHKALENWRTHQLSIINATTSGAERKAALGCLLDKEAEMLVGVDQMRAKVKKHKQIAALKQFLKLVCIYDVVSYKSKSYYDFPYIE